jgi:hypothetical protein
MVVEMPRRPGNERQQLKLAKKTQNPIFDLIGLRVRFLFLK